MKIDAKFDSGAIIVKDISNKDGLQAATLEIAHDAPHAGKPYLQWFHFRAYNIETSKKCIFHDLRHLTDLTSFVKGILPHGVM